MSGLPVCATQASHVRYAIAQTLAAKAPPSFGQECALTGSTSRGIADEYSDIEMMFYVETFPSYDERERWLQTVGARDIVFSCVFYLPLIINGSQIGSGFGLKRSI